MQTTSPTSIAATATLGPASMAPDHDVVAALRRGDNAAFARLVERYEGLMLRVASQYVRSGALAEEVVQDTWLSVLSGIEGFESRSSLKTWIFRILVNRAKTRGTRESRSVPFSSLSPGGSEDQPEGEQLLVDAARDRAGLTGSAAGQGLPPEHRVLAREVLERARRAIEQLPPGQRRVISMRDVEGRSAEEVCSTLGITGANQRVLLHRARSAVRDQLEDHLDMQAA